ncbi:SNF2 family N-terminal domain-containing protein [Fusarium venenatum]|uniref:SNF2 family N-terminal domain-containing protein n=1 Tax=Fusarium venenatum TaxID=56646 RepID=UPI001E16219B|nr:SNF2 family N-terminal domain-containing protein [Fusarium venenatum]
MAPWHPDNQMDPEPPTKRRRFFVDPEEASSDPVAHDSSPLPPPKRFFKDEDEIALETEQLETIAENPNDETPKLSPTEPPASQQESSVSFDQETFEAFIGDKVSGDVLSAIRSNCGNNLERAVNMYFDGTYKKVVKKSSRPAKQTASSSQTPNVPSERKLPIQTSKKMPNERYIGAFGVEGWATRSGTNLLKHGDIVKIERQKRAPPPTKAKGKAGPVTPLKGFGGAVKRQDVVVRFTTQSGTEVGRLAREAANWVSALIDEKICKFEGTVVYTPDRLRTNDTIFLQLRCSLLSSAFFSRSFQLADDRSAAFFDQNETNDEKTLRMRQVALVKLFQEINLHPTLTNSATKDGHEEKQKESKMSNGNGNSNAKEGEELEQGQLDALYKKAQSFDFSTPEAEPADTFAMTLRKYQKQALHWMMAKEKDEKSHREPSMHPLWEQYDWPLKDSKFYVNPYSGDLSLDFPVQEQHCLGGILADEMGLGKTIQMLSLVHTHRSEVALEARRSAVARSNVNQLTRLGKNSESVLDAPCTTLVVAPMSLLSQWQSEAEKASKDGTMKTELYYGNEKSSNLQALCCASNAANAPDLVITSYGVVLSEFSSLAARKGDKSFHNGLFSLRFFRIIIDEAHHIKNRSSKTAKACYEISATHRWALTGTPIVNKLEDLFSLVRFLGVEPWNNFSFWRTFITVPFESGDFMRALDVVQTVLEPLVLRRTKDMKTPDGEPLVLLPPKQIEIVDVELSETERDVYNYIFNKAKRTFSQNVEAGTVMKAFTTIFAQILRLRQSCCHPVLVRNRDIVADEVEAGAAADAAAGLADDMDLESLITSFTAAFGAHALEQIRDEAENECPLCFEEPMNDQTVTGCWHSACKNKAEVPRCFSCREPINKRDLFEVVRHDDDPGMMSKKSKISLQRVGVNASSAKVVALMSELRTLRREHPKMKSVVFSQFTSFLSLIEPALTRANINFLRLDGSMAQKARAAVLDKFTERKGFTILLLSLRAGGVGLNLTSAGRVFMMDPWWSFAVEAQAIDRVHRMGQESEVQVKRFVVKESVEERMLKVQERKKFIATSLGMMNDEEKKLQLHSLHLILSSFRWQFLYNYIHTLDHPSFKSGEEAEGSSNNVAATHGLFSRNGPEIKKYPQNEAAETSVEVVEEVVVTSAVKDKLEDEYDSDDEHHLCSLLLYFISKTLLNHLGDEPKEPPMDRFTEQLFGKQNQTARSRLPEEPSFMETFAKNLAKSAAKSAAKRAMGQTSSEKRTRDWARGTSSNQINPEDFRGVAEFVIGMLSSNSKSEQPRKGEDDRKKDRKRKRDKYKDRSKEVPRSRDVEDEGEKYGSDKERRKRRRHRVTFAEPYYEARPQEETYYPPPYEPRRHREERRRRRRQRRYKRDLDLKTLKTELEAMSSTIISLNARGASHRDCDAKPLLPRNPHKLHRRDASPGIIGIVVGLAILITILGAILFRWNWNHFKQAKNKITLSDTTPTVGILDFITDRILLTIGLRNSLNLHFILGVDIDSKFVYRMRWMHLRYIEGGRGPASLGREVIGGTECRVLDLYII